MGKWEVLPQQITMLRLIKWLEELWVNFIERRGRVLAFAKDRAAVNCAEEAVKLIGLIREATIIEKHILLGTAPLLLWLRSNTNGLCFRWRWRTRDIRGESEGRRGGSA